MTKVEGQLLKNNSFGIRSLSWAMFAKFIQRGTSISESRVLPIITQGLYREVCNGAFLLQVRPECLPL